MVLQQGRCPGPGQADDGQPVVSVGHVGVLPVRGQGHRVGVVRVAGGGHRRRRRVGDVDQAQARRAVGHVGQVSGERHVEGFVHGAGPGDADLVVREGAGLGPVGGALHSLQHHPVVVPLPVGHDGVDERGGAQGAQVLVRAAAVRRLPQLVLQAELLRAGKAHPLYAQLEVLPGDSGGEGQGNMLGQLQEEPHHRKSLGLALEELALGGEGNHGSRRSAVTAHSPRCRSSLRTEWDGGYTGSGLRELGSKTPERGWNESTEKPECFELMRLVAIRALMSSRFRKYLMIARRKVLDIRWMSLRGIWTNLPRSSTPPQDEAMKVRIPPQELAACLVCQYHSPADRPFCRFVIEPLEDGEDEPADLRE